MGVLRFRRKHNQSIAGPCEHRPRRTPRRGEPHRGRSQRGPQPRVTPRGQRRSTPRVHDDVRPEALDGGATASASVTSRSWRLARHGRAAPPRSATRSHPSSPGPGYEPPADDVRAFSASHHVRFSSYQLIVALRPGRTAYGGVAQGPGSRVIQGIPAIMALPVLATGVTISQPQPVSRHPVASGSARGWTAQRRHQM